MDRYEIIIYWSDEDGAYVADVPELPGCMAHGDTYETALSSVREAVQLWIDTAKESGDPVPVPRDVASSTRSRTSCRSGIRARTGPPLTAQAILLVAVRERTSRAEAERLCRDL